MFLYLYYLCITIFLVQGLLWPLLVIVSGIGWWRQRQKLAALDRELQRFNALGKTKNTTLDELILKNLPKLKPLKCARCGGAAVLRESEIMCPYCGQLSELPADYTATTSLRREIKTLLRSATSHWRVARILTSPLLSRFFFLMIFVEPLVVLPIAIIGSSTYENTWADQFLEALGEGLSFGLMLAAMLGLVAWMLLFIFLSKLSKDLRRQLPVIPVFEESMKERETATCDSCGGRIEFEKEAFASICSYCSVGNFRVQFTRRERASAEDKKSTTKSVLFGAMTIIEDFVGTFFFVSLLLLIASALLVVAQAI